jgi:hypothetical protein
MVRIWIRLITLMRIRILNFLFDVDPGPTFHLDAEPDPDPDPSLQKALTLEKVLI